jgi:hypothetical protein
MIAENLHFLSNYIKRIADFPNYLIFEILAKHRKKLALAVSTQLNNLKYKPLELLFQKSK